MVWNSNDTQRMCFSGYSGKKVMKILSCSFILTRMILDNNIFVTFQWSYFVKENSFDLLEQ